MQNNNEESKQDLLIGRNAIAEAIRAGREIDTLFVARGEKNGAVGNVIAMCREKGVTVKEVDRKKLDFMCGGENHQGAAAFVASHEYATVDDIFNLAKERNEQPFVVVLDEVEDPHNLGAIIRTAELAGVHGIIIPKRRSASLSYAVGKTSAGALEYMPVARVANLAAAIDELKSRGCWIYGADMSGTDCREMKIDGAVALVIGSEGSGLGRLVKEKCDFLLSLKQKGKINSLNASVAAGILMYEIMYQRDK